MRQLDLFAPRLRLGRWASMRGRGPFAVDACSFAGISGGRTSAMMAALLPGWTRFVFCNTGREHPRTLDFLNELNAALGGRIVWLELRKPAVRGDAPKNFRFEVVSYETASRDGRPFLDMMEALAEYRATKNMDPVAPWAGSRICTAYMKNRVQTAYARSLGAEAFDQCIGLRADEPQRVHRLRDRSTGEQTFRMPLYDASITKADVMEFWRAQSFDLRIEERQGNCTGCFLKDQGDLARVLQEPETDAAWWIAMEDRYPRFGGDKFAGYRQLANEGPLREQIERDIRATRVPTNNGSVSDRRFRLVVKQENLRMRGERAAFSCACESSFLSDDEQMMPSARLEAAGVAGVA